MVTYRSAREWARMREAGRVVAHTLQAVAEVVEPGITLDELDAVAARKIKEMGALPSFQGYHPSWAPTPYPGVVCLSVNDVIVHGLPNGRALADGDVLSIDCGAELAGYHGDAAITVGVGTVDGAARRLMDATSQALERAIAAALPGGRMGDIAHEVERTAQDAGYGIPEGWGGHGIGNAMHEDPAVPNRGRPGRGLRLKEGLTIAIEPMFHEGGQDQTRTMPDGWSMATRDGSRAAHFEHSIAITGDGPVVLTLP
ncbi:type I methionyl aminopeptidase [Spirillospora sp. NPDC047279]|uniref:type I methionyl aminopeptidase n=1 Tax=Spirillospora sp. NPDC047279 TaxID=3155478 RepID=UPI0033D42EFF